VLHPVTPAGNNKISMAFPLLAFLAIDASGITCQNSGAENLINDHCIHPEISESVYCRAWGTRCGLVVRQTMTKAVNPFREDAFNNLMYYGVSSYACFYVRTQTGTCGGIEGTYNSLQMYVPAPDDVLGQTMEPAGLETFPVGGLASESATCQEEIALAEAVFAADYSGLNFYDATDEVDAATWASITCTPDDEVSGPRILNRFRCSQNGCMGTEYAPPHSDGI